MVSVRVAKPDGPETTTLGVDLPRETLIRTVSVEVPFARSTRTGVGDEGRGSALTAEGATSTEVAIKAPAVIASMARLDTWEREDAMRMPPTLSINTASK